MTPTLEMNAARSPSPSRHDEARHFWFARVNYEQRSPRPDDLKLDRMRALLELLGNPHQRLKIIHVAGSKGKGSTSAMLAAIARRSGYRTGLFTSPHLVQVEERFQIDDRPIAPHELDELLLEIRDACAHPAARQRWGDDLAEALTFFEIATAAGFLYFVRRRVELAVLEVGLGGRLDSTNVCRPLLSIITSISFDHTQQLGNTLAKIAFEKAGIVKPGRPVLSGAQDVTAREVIESICRERRSPLRQLGAEIRYEYEPVGKGEGARGRVQVVTNLRHWPAMELGLIGEHQAANAALVTAAVEELRRIGLHISDKAVAEGLAEVHWPARLEVVGRNPLVLLDCAHNIASAQALVQTLRTSFPLPDADRRFLIFAGSRDKDLRGMFEMLVPFFDHVVLTRFVSNPRCVLPEQALELMPAEYRSKCTLCDDTALAWQEVRGRVGGDDLICITGSVFLAGEMLAVLRGDGAER
jgi:dihydrofolate synthase/folylpolyglutamate synthase